MASVAALQRMKLPGFGFYPEERRSYPQRSVAAQVLGYVGIDGNGLSGLELQLDRELAGRAGKETVVKDPAGRVIDVVGQRREIPGRDLFLTLDHGIQANAEEVPLPDATFDLAFSEYGASIWCDSERWIPEAARLLRPGGELVFVRNTDLEMVCSPDEGKVVERLVRPLRGMNRLDWSEDGQPSTEFHLSTTDLFQLLRRTGFDVVDYRQLYASDDSVDHPRYDFVPAEWGRRWPSEEVWHARKR